MNAHYLASPPPDDWRAWLAERLGQRPRRIGPWVELALYGARRCLDEAGLEVLPPRATIRVASLNGPMTATRSAAEQLRGGLPMPFAFLQSQPCQVLATLGMYLGAPAGSAQDARGPSEGQRDASRGQGAWQGDARFVVSRDRAALLRMAEREAGGKGLLYGWVEEGEPAATEWWWLHGG